MPCAWGRRANEGRDFRLIFAATVRTAVAGRISGLALRQRITPEEMPDRVTATLLRVSACGIVLWSAASRLPPEGPEA